MLHKVIFLDRDGVINRDSPRYVKSWQEFEFLPGSLSALRRLALAQYTVILITNQPALNRGLMAPSALEDIHVRLRAAVQQAGGEIADIFFCPHRPDEGCSCRKPKPGMILLAAGKWDIALADSVMVGDSAKDILCGKAAGCGSTVLVRTGNGALADLELARQSVYPDFSARDLEEAVTWILGHSVEPV